MRHLFFTILASILLLASCGVPQREGIQWGDIHFGPQDEYGEVAEAWLLYTTSDGTVDSINFMLTYSMKPDFFFENGGGHIDEDDINFDGIPDLQIELGCFDVSCNNVNYEGFVWDPKKGVFVLVPGYSKIMNPNIEGDAIVGYEREWDYGKMEFYCEKYQWVNGELVQTEDWFFNPYEGEEDMEYEEEDGEEENEE